jgi:hypothetical protein
VLAHQLGTHAGELALESIAASGQRARMQFFPTSDGGSDRLFLLSKIPSMPEEFSARDQGTVAKLHNELLHPSEEYVWFTTPGDQRSPACERKGWTSEPIAAAAAAAAASETSYSDRCIPLVLASLRSLAHPSLCPAEPLPLSCARVARSLNPRSARPNL